MATSTCPKCPSKEFEKKEHELSGSDFKVNFVQCAACGAVVGVMSFHDTHTLLDQIGAPAGSGHLLP
jgi:hypothetical protein